MKQEQEESDEELEDEMETNGIPGSGSGTAVREKVMDRILPEKSRSHYERQYQKFKIWCNNNNIAEIAESSVMAYFSEVPSARSLWAQYSMLKACIILHDNVDISKFPRLLALIKKATRGIKPKQTAVLEDEHINKFLTEAPNLTHLMTKVALIIGISGGCRRIELCKLTTDELEFKTDLVMVNIPAVKNLGRTFAVTRPEWVELIKDYAYKRPADCKTNRFFLTYRYGKCISCPVGINMIGKIPYTIASYLQLPSPELYTGHCFRRTSSTLRCNYIGRVVRKPPSVVEAPEETFDDSDLSNSISLQNTLPFSNHIDDASVSKAQGNCGENGRIATTVHSSITTLADPGCSSSHSITTNGVPLCSISISGTCKMEIKVFDHSISQVRRN